MNSHLLPYPYNQTRRSILRYDGLAKFLYDVYLQSQRSIVSTSNTTNPLRVVCISDTHNSTFDIPNGDILIHAGDLTQHGSFDEIQAQLKWLSSLPHPHKVMIAGNHDLLLDSSFTTRFPIRVSGSEPPISNFNWDDIIYLQNDSVVLDFPNGRKLKVYGSPETPEYGLWAFQYPAIRDVWTLQIPEDADVVVTHGPPALHCDVKKKGDGYLLRELRRVKPQLVVFSHVHDGYGEGRLFHDGVQSAAEDIALQRGSGLLTILRMSLYILVSWLRVLLGLSQADTTRLVNAAVAPGANERSRKEPIVFEI